MADLSRSDKLDWSSCCVGIFFDDDEWWEKRKVALFRTGDKNNVSCVFVSLDKRWWMSIEIIGLRLDPWLSMELYCHEATMNTIGQWQCIFTSGDLRVTRVAIDLMLLTFTNKTMCHRMEDMWSNKSRGQPGTRAKYTKNGRKFWYIGNSVIRLKA